jgi:SAM-dependent methyltransferase
MIIQSYLGRVIIPDDMVAEISSFTGLSPAKCVERLASYDSREIGIAWSSDGPRNEDEIREFYSKIDFYIWELSIWHNSVSYEPYITAINHIIDSKKKIRRRMRVLDYGSGIGTAALLFGRNGYHVTIADVPGPTLEFAKWRLSNSGIDFDVIEIRENSPVISGLFDAIVCFDVLEHVKRPGAVFQSLMKHLTRHGLITVAASFDAQPEHAPYHLREGYLRWGSLRWPLFMSGCGLRRVSPMVYTRDRWLFRKVRALHYRVWAMTGILVLWLPRRMKDR